MTGERTETSFLSCEEVAAGWCVRLAEGQLTEPEREAFDAWIGDPSCHEAFEEALSVWRAVDGLGAQPELIQLRSEALDSYRKGQARRWASRRMAAWRPVAAAAVAVAAIVLLTIMLQPKARIYETGIAERRIAILEDGSRLSMDAATQVKVRMTKDKRELRLVKGRAKFDVVGQPLRPFSVAAGDKIVVAVGTSFSVELVRSQMRVFLYEGHVRILEETPRAPSLPGDVSGPPRKDSVHSEWSLEPGRELVASISEPLTRQAPADMTNSLTWETGRLTFIDEPLSMAAERLNRYSQRKVVIPEAAVGRLRINGVFKAEDVEAFVEGTEALLPVRIERQPDQILILSR